MWLDCTAGSTALEIAVRSGHVAAEKALLAAGARPAGQEAREEAAEATRELLKEKIDHDL
jgi:ankyrin repeat protein